MTEKNDKYPNGFESVLLVIALFLAEVVVASVLHDVEGTVGMPARDLDGIVVLLGNGCVLTLVMHFKGLSYRDLFHSSSSSAKATLLVLLPAILLTLPILVLAMGTVMEVLVRWIPMSAWEEAMFERMGSGSVGSIVMACVLAPVLEEMMFRGVILRSFLRQYSRWTAIAGSAVVFGIAHLNIYQFVVALVLGVFSGWLYVRTRSLLPCIALHGSYNSVLMMMSLSGAGQSGMDQDVTSATSWLTALVLGAAGIQMFRLTLLRKSPQQG